MSKTVEEYMEIQNAINKAMRPTGSPVLTMEEGDGYYLSIPGYGFELHIQIDNIGSVTGYLADTAD